MKPNGTVTFLFTDIEGSTKLAQKFHDKLQEALKKHHAILKESIESNNGFIFKTVGDSFCCAFQNPADAINAAVDSQKNLKAEKWNDTDITVRMGIHSGNAEWSGSDYMGYITLARTSRVMSVAYGGQILISNDAYKLTDTEHLNGISFRDLGERRLKDLVQPMNLYQILSPELLSDFPPLKTLDARPNNLPVQLTNFIGREKELLDIKKLLTSIRLLTILGSGGTGKTRLALQAAADLIDEFANGVYISEMAAITDPFYITQVLSDSLQVKEKPGFSQEESLIDFLKEKKILIIIDNCEHLINECAKLTGRLLQSCPGLKIIATSREALNCIGEQIFRLPSMTVPENLTESNPEQITQYESVRLFIERALSVNINFRVNEDNAQALAGICSRLDGIPLAIELAAARIRVMSVEKIFERLDDRFTLLTGGNRTSLPRQQTLRALIDWSYELLTEKEKILWQRLSVFNDGWTMNSAEEICSDEILSKNDIPDLLIHLADKSIIIYEDLKDRFRMLETIKQYGSVKLNENNDETGIHLKLINYFKSISAFEKFRSADKSITEWMNIMDAEHNNILSAIEWLMKNRMYEMCSDIVTELGNFWNTRGHVLTGYKIVKDLLEHRAEINKSNTAILYSESGNFLRAQGIFEKAKESYEKCLELSLDLDFKSQIAIALLGLGNAEAQTGNFKKAESFFKKSLAVSRECDYTSGITFSLNNLGNISLVLGDLNQAEKYNKESLEINRKSGNKRDIAFTLDTMSNILIELGNYELSLKCLEECLEITREIGDKSGIAFALNNMSGIFHRKGNNEQAKSYLEESLRIRLEIEDKNGIAYSYFNLGNIFFEEKKFEQAREYFRNSLKLRIELGDMLGIAYSLLSVNSILEKENKSLNSAKILGIFKNIIDSIGLDEGNHEFNFHQNLSKKIQEKLNIKEYSEYFNEGYRMKNDEALKYAVEQLS